MVDQMVGIDGEKPNVNFVCHNSKLRDDAQRANANPVVPACEIVLLGSSNQVFLIGVVPSRVAGHAAMTSSEVDRPFSLPGANDQNVRDVLMWAVSRLRLLSGSKKISRYACSWRLRFCGTWDLFAPCWRMRVSLLRDSGATETAT